MPWSMKLGRWLGIDVYVHALFIGLLALVGGAALFTGGMAEAAGTLGFLVLLFACVLAHEYGHALMARAFGIETKDITLLPIGGLARLERIPERPIEEFLVAIAGPLVNVGLAGVLFSAWLLFGLRPLESITLGNLTLVEQLLMANVTLVFFNLLPAFPMDGGRILRALLAALMPYAVATRWAARVGRVMAVLFVIAGFTSGNLMLAAIAVFVWLSAGQEARFAEQKAVFDGVRVARVMRTDLPVLHPAQMLGEAGELMLQRGLRELPVADAHHILGLVTLDGVFGALREQGPYGRVSTAVRTDVPEVAPGDDLNNAIQTLQSANSPTALVVSGGTLVGVLSAEQIHAYAQWKSALGPRPPAAPQPYSA